jgi:uncharacterized membrane protein YfcA
LPTLPVPPSEIALALVLAALGATLQGSIGFGLAVVSAPLLLLIDPVWVPGPMLLAAMLLVMLIAHRDRAHILEGDVALGTVGRVLGTIPAAYALYVLPQHVYDLVFAAMVLAGVALSASGVHIARTRLNVVVAGTLSGIAGTISSIGGPPMALVYQHERGPSVRGTMSAIFVVGTWISIAGLWWAGRFGNVELLLGLVLMPAILAGFAVSRYTAAWLDRRRTRPAILAVSAVSALVILVRAIYNLI